MHRTATFATFLCPSILAWPAPAAAADPVAAKAKVDEARALLAAGKGEEAIPLFRDAIRLDPNAAAAHNALGSLLNRAGRYAEALPHAEAAVRLDPSNGRYRYNRGVVRAEHGQFADAVADFDAALAAHPDLTYAWLERGAAKLSLGDPSGARADWEQAAKTDPKLIWPVFYSASGHFLDGRYAEAAAGFDRVAQAERGFVPAALWRVVAHGRAGKPIAVPEQPAADWPGPVLALYRGTISAEELLEIAERDRTTGDRRRVGEALYFLAQRALIAGKKAAPLDYLRRSIAVPAPRHAWKIAAEGDLRALEAR